MSNSDNCSFNIERIREQEVKNKELDLLPKHIQLKQILKELPSCKKD